MNPETEVVNNSLQIADNLFSSDLFNTILIGVLVYIGILWIAIILWVTKDITNRSNNILLQIISISLVIFLTPIFGLVIYLILRPSRTLIEKYYEEVEFDILQNDELESCASCHSRIRSEYKFCPACGVNTQKSCVSCKKHIQKSWSNCAFCGTHQPSPIKLNKVEQSDKRNSNKEDKSPSKEEKEAPSSRIKKKDSKTKSANMKK